MALVLKQNSYSEEGEGKAKVLRLYGFSFDL